MSRTTGELFLAVLFCIIVIISDFNRSVLKAAFDLNLVTVGHTLLMLYLTSLYKHGIGQKC